MVGTRAQHIEKADSKAEFAVSLGSDEFGLASAEAGRLMDKHIRCIVHCDEELCR